VLVAVTITTLISWGMGFGCKGGCAKIASPKVQELVAASTGMNDITEMANQRTANTELMEAAKRTTIKSEC
jgi:hypothetical protein